MKVGLLSSILSPSAAGLAGAVQPLAWGLHSRGIDVKVFGAIDPDFREAANGWGPSIKGADVQKPERFGYAPGYRQHLFSAALDVTDVHGLWTYPSLLNHRLHQQTGTPYIVTPHGMLDPWSRDRSRLKKWIVRKWFEGAHLSAASCLRATTPTEAEHFRNLGLRNPIAIIPHGADVPALSSSERPTVRRLLFLSRLHPGKGLDYLLRAWASVAAEMSNWELLVAGPDEAGYGASMREFAEREKIPRVRWHPSVSGEERDALYQSADLFVLPTHSENFGLVVTEALVRNVPVITTRNAPWEGLEQNGCGWWINLNDNALRAAMLEAMSLPRQQLRAMGQAGRDWVKREFGWAKIIDDMSELYRWVASGGSPPPFVFED